MEGRIPFRFVWYSLSAWRLRLFLFFIQLIIRLEESHQAILFPFYHCILFINRKVESSDQLSVFPGLVDVELVIEFSVTWQE